MRKRDWFFGAVLLGSITQVMVDLIVLTKMDIIEVWFLACMIGILITAGVGALLEDSKPKKKRRKKTACLERRLPIVNPEDVMVELSTSRREHEA